MQQHFFKIFFLLITSFILTSFTNTEDTELYSLTVNVAELNNSDGIVQFSLYNHDGVFPDEQFERYYKQLKSSIVNNEATITFKNLPKGTYAINILHDENNNGVIDKGWVLPVEGLGFSNFQALNIVNRPNFKKAKFELNANKTIKVKIIYL